MASKLQTAVGSAAWIAAEKENVAQLLEQEKEDIVYPAQHEMEWLNEHMAEIFNKNQFNVTEIFKTPGKLRGKTPRTIRKQNALQARVPLSDVFASPQPHTASLSRPTEFNKQIANFRVAKDAEEEAAVVIKPATKQTTDSGYHGMTEDEMEINQANGVLDEQPKVAEVSQIQKQVITSPSDGRRTTETSFHSAQEVPQSREPISGPPRIPIQTDNVDESTLRPNAQVALESVLTRSPAPLQAPKAAEMVPVKEAISLVNEFDDLGSPSDGSTPDRPLVRKSSLTFASLPARQPLTTKRSMGARASRTSQIEQTINGPNRNSYIGRQNGGLSLAQEATIDDAEEMELDEDGPTRETSVVESQATRLHNKSSTQRLHERIDMLGKSQPSRPSKSIPSLVNSTNTHPAYPELPSVRPENNDAPAQKTAPAKNVADDDDDWIKPLASPREARRPQLPKSHTTDVMQHILGKEDDVDMDFTFPPPEQIPNNSPLRKSPGPLRHPSGYGHAKSASTTVLTSPARPIMAPAGRHTKAISVSNPALDSTTPQGSPKRFDHGPLSASKSKLQSIMKTAKGLFTSSAGVSAAAKMETLSPTAIRMAANAGSELYPSMHQTIAFDKPLPESPPKERRTRSSMEKEEKRKEKEAKDRQKLEDQLEKAREKERLRESHIKSGQEKQAQSRTNHAPQPLRKSPRRLQEQEQQAEHEMETAQEHAMGPPAPPASQQPSTLKGSEARRPVKPSRDAAPKPKPQPVAIRVGTMSQRIPLSTASLSASLQESLPPSGAKSAGLAKKPSNASLQTTASTNSFKSSVSSQAAKPKALIAAERKKEQDEREAQRKVEQKREMERKRAAQQEEARRQEQRRAEPERKERERAAAEDPRKLAQKQAIEKRRLENARKMEQHRNPQLANNDLSSMLQHEKPTMGNQSRGDLGANQPPSRLNSVQPPNRSVVNHQLVPNPAKSIKRVLDDEPGPSRVQAPKFGGASEHADSKRRKTDDDDDDNFIVHVQEPPVRPTMAPPIRASNIKKKVPFADAPNPPPGLHKTPTQPAAQGKITLVKSSPQYTNGELIHLPEIPTDSEDEDSDDDNAFPVPAWAESEALTRQLVAQDAMDGDQVFGPIAPLKMEEIFRGNKDRMKRFRDRTSSANWGGPDGLTQEEIMKDNAGREQMRQNGGWTYGL